jgi:hypothetical protein
MTKWHDVPGATLVDPYCQVTLHWRSSGHHEPASMYGGPARVGWPEERVDERELERAEIELDCEVTITVTDWATLTLLAELYRDEIADTELPDDE